MTSPATRDLLALITAFDAGGWRELRVEYQGCSILLSRDAASSGIVPRVDAGAAPPPARPAALPAATAVPAVTAAEPGWIAVTAPNLGTFYRAPKPGSPPFVEIGHRIAAGDPVCLLEVMKLFTTVTAAAAGTIRGIAGRDGELVDAGQLLFHIAPIESGPPSMAHIHFVDETMRDGQQALWGLRMRAGMALPVSPLIDRTGFQVIDLTGGGMLDVLTRFCQENYFEGLDLLVASMPRTPVRAGLRANANVTFGITPPALMDLWVRRLCAHGVRSFWIYDVLFGIDNMLRLAKVAKESNAKVAGAIMFALSPVHTDQFFVANARALAASPYVDSILLYDTAGVLEKERLQALVPALVGAANGKPIEYHSNNLLGLSAKAYLDAIDLGVSVIHTASRPMANGPSVPSTEIMARNLGLRGHTHDLDESLFEPVADHFRAVGLAAGYLVDQFAEYDEFSIQHQIPGGMMGTFKAQLAQHRMLDKLPAVLDEVAAVRRELGYPGMATPFSQLVGIQAVLNIVTGKRYGTVPDEVIQYAAGFYGQTVAPVDPDIMDRIMAAPRAAEVVANPPETPDIATLKARHGTDDEDELIYRAFLPQADIDRMRTAGPVRRDYPLLASPELEQVRKLMELTRLPLVEIRTAELSVTLRR